MAKHLGGETVAAGFYADMAEWSVETFSGAGGVLPGDATRVYRQVPAIVLLMAAPLLGIYFWANGIDWTTTDPDHLDAVEKFLVKDLAPHVSAFDLPHNLLAEIPGDKIVALYRAAASTGA